MGPIASKLSQNVVPLLDVAQTRRRAGAASAQSQQAQRHALLCFALRRRMRKPTLRRIFLLATPHHGVWALALDVLGVKFQCDECTATAIWYVEPATLRSFSRLANLSTVQHRILLAPTKHRATGTFIAVPKL